MRTSMITRSLVASLASLVSLAQVVSCTPTTPTTARPTNPPPQGGYYPQQGYPQQAYPQQNGGYPAQPGPYGQAPQQQPYPQPQPQPGPTARPLLAPLVGSLAMQQETRSILAELVTNLGATNRQRVAGIPLVFDPAPEVNAYAGCDERGTPFLAGTEGLLAAVDAIAQTKATDELFGTQTYEAYVAAVVPNIVRSETASAGLPAGIIPVQYGADARRWSRAHELFDDVIAFTFGHELAHHYLGHTGCANGQPMGPGPAQVGHLITKVLPFINQPNEAASDSAGAINALDAGVARRPNYRLSEKGGVLLLDFFARMSRAAGANPLSWTNVLRSHPNPEFRLPIVQTVARTWYMQHPTVQ